MATRNVLAKAYQEGKAKELSAELTLSEANPAKLVYTLSENTRLEDLLKRSAEDTVVIGEVVLHRSENGLFNLNDLYKASGSPLNKQPPEYFRTEEGHRYVTEPKFQSEVLTKRGASGGTWASKRVAYSYAAYLSQEFYDLVYDTFESVQGYQISKTQEVAVNLLHTGVATVKELAEATKALEFKQREVDVRVQERDDYRQKLVSYRSPFAKDHKEASEKAAMDLRYINSELQKRLEKALTFSGLVGNGLERLRRYIPKEDTKSHKELAEINTRNSKVIQILNNEES